uniref:translation initiation factor IF-2-like n=1 Tax=Myodes glareolus TaxID=447135 RepID=UPI0020203619|nr:translation initiation factor IF-2-like [Myodes glareolus]
MGPTVRGDAGLPRSRRPTTLAGATSPGPAFLPERHRNPGSRRPLLAGDLGRGGPRLRDPRGSVSEDRVPETTRFRALPTCLPLRRRPMSLPASPATRLGRLPGSQPSPVTLGAPSGPYGAASSEIGGRSN